MPAKTKNDAEFAERFWEKVVRTSTCWLWTGAKNKLGYGWVRRRPKVYSAHRLAWELTHGPILDGLWVLHRCDVPTCVNPDHLFLGTHRDNEADKAQKGRARRIGTRNASLNATQVREIRALYAAKRLSQREIADQYGVTQGTVSSVVRRVTYAYIE